ncbi:phenylalanine--tRNA ligase subunit beta [Eubacteriales bacterium KG127]
MLVSWKWLKDYIEIKEEVTEYCDGMIMSGSNLETCQKIAEGIKGVLIGKIKKIEKHPNADKLVVCRIDVAKENLVQIVTGAQNVFEGAIIPVAVDGSTIPGPLHGQPKADGGVTIKSGKLRGVLSNGMLCSASELGFDDKVVPMESKDGIWILGKEFENKIGMPVQEALELDDYTIDFEITPNRPDCLSMLGMARETMATFGGELRMPDTSILESNHKEKAQDFLSVDVKSDLCLRYTARVIKDVKMGQSPWWMQKRLMAAGMRPINVIVDITNFVMLEYGQPLHAFDIREISRNKIIVDNAVDGEVFQTLDAKERTLDSSMLMIRDGEKSVAIAGVMGGMNSEIMEDTDTIVLESANFASNSIRATSKKLGLRTEASVRYEKGIDPNLARLASDRFCHLIEKLNVGTVIPGIIDVYKKPVVAQPISVRVERINKVLGTDLTARKMAEILQTLECRVEFEDSVDTEKTAVLTVYPPTVRQDLLKEVDFVEEVARIYGYDNLPMELPKSNSIPSVSKSWMLRSKARKVLNSIGLNEIQTISFASPSDLDKIMIDEDAIERAYVKILNPLGEDTSILRTILLPDMLEVLGRNFSRSVENVRAFEIGTTFLKNFVEDGGLPYEDFNICLGAYGEGEDFFKMKARVETLLYELGIKNIRFTAESEYGPYHPGRCARISTMAENGEEVEIAIVGQVHPDVCENFGLDTEVYGAELMMAPIEEFSNKKINYKKPPKFPGTSRDISLTVDENITAGEILDVINENPDEIFKGAKIFDIYRGEQVGENKKSISIRLLYGDDEKTLTDTEVSSANQTILVRLADKLHATLREQ